MLRTKEERKHGYKKFGYDQSKKRSLKEFQSGSKDYPGREAEDLQMANAGISTQSQKRFKDNKGDSVIPKRGHNTDEVIGI